MTVPLILDLSDGLESADLALSYDTSRLEFLSTGDVRRGSLTGIGPEVSVKKHDDAILARIEAFNEAQGGGVIIRKAAGGYSLFREETGQPVARLRPRGSADKVEVMWWSHRDKWDQIGDFGPMILTLDEALDYIARDPMGCFWH